MKYMAGKPRVHMMPVSHRYLLLLPLVVALIIAACGGDDDGAATPTPSGSTQPSEVPTLDPLRAELASILLTEDDVPQGLQASGLNFSSNEDLAGPSDEELLRLDELGRLMGVDLTFIPTTVLPEDSPVRGGIQNSASVYENAAGASQSFEQTEAEIRLTEWAPSYKDLTGLGVREIDRQIGDESIWVRISGFDQCTQVTPPGAAPGTTPSETCPPTRLITDDFVIFRVGRVRSLVKVLAAHDQFSPPEVFLDQLEAWAQTVVDNARETYGP